MTDQDTKPRSRRWYQFRLQTLLIVMALCAVALAPLAADIRFRRLQQPMIERLYADGAMVNADPRWSLTGPSFGPIFMAQFNGGFDAWFGPHITSLHHDKVDLKQLAPLKKLESLGIEGAPITDLSPLIELRNLNEFYVDGSSAYSGTWVCDCWSRIYEKDRPELPLTDISPLARLKNLEVLSLACTNVSDLRPLANLAKLRRLNLGFTPVTDLAPLSTLTNLEALSLKGTQLTEAQIAELQIALPDCQIYHQFLPECQDIDDCCYTVP